MKQNGLRFLVQNRAAFCLVRVVPQKQCGLLMRHYYSKTARYGLHNDRTFSIDINSNDTSISTLRVLFLPGVTKRQRG